LFSPIHPKIHYAFDRISANFFTAIAREYGDGVTGKAVSTYFDRAKKDPYWDRTKSVADIRTENGGTTAVKTSTPRKRAPKGSAKKAAAMMGDGDDEETSEFNDTPSKKKTPLNKVCGGRVTKSGRAKPISYVGQDADENEEEVEEDEEPIVKMEDTPASSNGDGYENGNGYGDHGYKNGYAVSGADETETFYAAAEDYGEV
jgi:hypothetical protein